MRMGDCVRPLRRVVPAVAKRTRNGDDVGVDEVDVEVERGRQPFQLGAREATNDIGHGFVVNALDTIGAVVECKRGDCMSAKRAPFAGP